jgi:hypothetical protein
LKCKPDIVLYCNSERLDEIIRQKKQEKKERRNSTTSFLSLSFNKVSRKDSEFNDNASTSSKASIAFWKKPSTTKRQYIQHEFNVRSFSPQPTPEILIDNYESTSGRESQEKQAYPTSGRESQDKQADPTSGRESQDKQADPTSGRESQENQERSSPRKTTTKKSKKTPDLLPVLMHMTEKQEKMKEVEKLKSTKRLKAPDNKSEHRLSISSLATSFSNGLRSIGTKSFHKEAKTYEDTDSNGSSLRLSTADIESSSRNSASSFGPSPKIDCGQ